MPGNMRQSHLGLLKQLGMAAHVHPIPRVCRAWRAWLRGFDLHKKSVDCVSPPLCMLDKRPNNPPTTFRCLLLVGFDHVVYTRIAIDFRRRFLPRIHSFVT